ncbi:MAG: hypothetical protein PVH87_07235 [Desulfobacteraceae bacterium]
MVKKVLWVMLLTTVFAATAWSQNISGEYSVKVKGTNVFLDRSPSRQHITDQTTLKVEQRGERVTMEFGAFGGASPATIFKGKAGNGRFAAVWWYQGSAHETKVLWGSIRNRKLHGRLIYPRVAYRQGLVPGWVEIDFEAVKKRKVKPLKPVGRVDRGEGPVVHAPGEPVSLHEDCLGFDPRRLELKAESGRYLMTDGRSRMKMFPNRREARLALKTIRHYGMDQHCFVGRPDPSMEYWPVDGRAPSGSFQGEDCIGFDPGRLRLKREGSQWLMTDGRSRMRMFPNRREAEQSLAIIRKYHFNQTCYIGRPDPSMTYFRK